MMLFPHELSPTRAAGLFSYGIAGCCSGIAWLWVALQARRSAWLAAMLTLAEVFFFLDMIFEWRLVWNESLRRSFELHGIYEQRRWIQVLCLMLFAALMTLMFRAWMRKLRGRLGARLAVCGLGFSIGCWCVEVISLHATDSVLYHLYGGVMAVAYLWILAALLASAGILLDAGGR